MRCISKWRRTDSGEEETKNVKRKRRVPGAHWINNRREGSEERRTSEETTAPEENGETLTSFERAV